MLIIFFRLPQSSVHALRWSLETLRRNQELMLIIEVDGSSHEWEGVAERDAIRQGRLEEAGFIVLRFTNEEVLKNISSVRDRLVHWIEKNK